MACLWQTGLPRARGLSLPLSVQLQQQERWLGFKLLWVVSGRAQTGRERSQPSAGFAARSPRRDSQVGALLPKAPAATCVSCFPVESRQVMLWERRYLPRLETSGFLSRHSAVWLKQDLHVNVNARFQCVPRERKIPKPTLSKAWGKVLLCEPKGRRWAGGKQWKR